MAINSNGILNDKSATRSLCSSNTSNISSCRLIKINFAGKDSCSSSKANKPNSKDIKSPYLTNDKVQLLSRVTEKKVVHKKPTDYVSSFPLAVNVYKANSDEFKVKKRGTKKVKKSVLTLPNEPAPMPKTYTVSDLNDSECFAYDNRANKQKKRRSVKRTKKPRVKDRAMEFYDRDARYCSQLNINLDCSSSEIVDITGDGEKISKLYKSNNSISACNDSHDMWTVLRNINQFQFRPSPPESQESIVPLRKRRPLVRKSNNCNDTHIIETCHTQEFAYISSFEIDSKSQESCSPSSSIDRVTVINKESDPNDIMEQFSQKIFGSNFQRKEKNKLFCQNWGRNKPQLKNSNKKASQNKKRIEDNQLTAFDNRISLQSERGNTLTYCGSPILLELEPNDCKSGSIRETESVANNIDHNNISNKRALIQSHNANVNVLKPTDDSEKQTIGITKVILNKGQQDMVTSKFPDSLKKARTTSTLPNTTVPKLTQTEIKRRLANLKFPIVILGKDQLTNCAIQVPNIDPPQFSGLDHNIWPFMVEWSMGKKSQNVQVSEKKEILNIKSKPQKTKHKVSPPESDLPKYGVIVKKVDEPKKIGNSNFPATVRNSKQLFNDTPSQPARKPKSISLLKSKMFQFLNKNPPNPNTHNIWSSNGQLHRDKTVGTNDTVINEDNHVTEQMVHNLSGYGPSVPITPKEKTKTPVENRLVKKSYASIRHPWAKGKWASDVIETIIKKIRSGVYYGVDRKETQNNMHWKEVSTQTESNISRNAYCQNSAYTDFESKLPLNKTDDPLKKLPGFDKTFTTLEIETISTNQIAVKQCVTNVIVQFDIKVLAEGNDLMHKRGSMSCIPVQLQYSKDNQEKIFKCNTSILNASLPAELCSIIPSMMRSILDADKKICTSPAITLNVESPLTPIVELKGFESPEVNMYSILPGLPVSNQIRPMLNGRFQFAQFNRKIIIRTEFRLSIDLKDSIASIFDGVNLSLLWYPYHQIGNFQTITNSYNSSNMLTKNPVPIPNKSSTCMALQLYEPRSLSIIPTFGTANFVNSIVNKLNLINLFTNTLKLKCYGHICNNNSVIVNRPMVIPQSEIHNTMLVTPISDVGVISLFNAFTKNNNDVNTTFGKPVSNSIQTGLERNMETRSKCDKNKTETRKKGQPIKILRKKSFVKCYRKCNSMSSIYSYKSTQLNRITNLDDFCQALGSNTVSSVLDGCLNKKILQALAEMKNWITEITPKQALLILLLMNKKDTPNLIRFRPVLLQGIAVNRITKAVELDTEIEVIERENLNKIAQYEGISYLPASAENQDNLLEELYWIAKTTASDYQKTFDESSEKLLKSLIKKRKKLNPSYLRVMARYVGLGLLSPAK